MTLAAERADLPAPGCSTIRRPARKKAGKTHASPPSEAFSNSRRDIPCPVPHASREKHHFRLGYEKSGLEEHHMTITGSGAREIYRVFKHLNTIQSRPTFALANRLILRQNGCEIWSLSPDDTAILNFLHSIKQWFPDKRQGKFRVPN